MRQTTRSATTPTLNPPASVGHSFDLNEDAELAALLERFNAPVSWEDDEDEDDDVLDDDEDLDLGDEEDEDFFDDDEDLDDEDDEDLDDE